LAAKFVEEKGGRPISAGMVKNPRIEGVCVGMSTCPRHSLAMDSGEKKHIEKEKAGKT